MRRVVVLVALSLVVAACGDINVATVNGSSLSLSDIPVDPDGFDVPEEVFLDALNWKIRDRVLLMAAATEFQIRLNPDQVATTAASILAGLPPENQADPRANLAYFETWARVAQGVGLLWPLLGEALGDDLATNNWADGTLRNADIRVKRRFGVWRVDPNPLVYPE